MHTDGSFLPVCGNAVDKYKEASSRDYELTTYSLEYQSGAVVVVTVVVVVVVVVVVGIVVAQAS